MVANFYQDLARGKEAEAIVLNALNNLESEYSFYDVSDVRSYWHRGDIRAVSASGKEVFIEVKDDSRIADTHNVLCEDEIWYDDISAFVDGNMHSDYEIYAILSRAENKIYIINFEVMKQIYKSKGRYEVIPHKGQITYCYLLPLGALEKAGGIIAEVAL